MSSSGTNVLPLPIRDRLLMAYAVCEWASALTHLTSLRQVGCRVSDEVFVQIGQELTSFTSLWAVTNDHPEWQITDTVENATAWLSQHTEELDALLKEVEMG